MSETTNDTLVTIRFTGTVTVSPKDIPPPGDGSTAIAEAAQRIMASRGIAVTVSKIHTLTLSRDNPNKEEIFREKISKVLDSEGNIMPDRQIEIVQHPDLSHPFSLLIANNRNQPWRIQGYYATIEDANGIGEAWQEGRIEFLLEDLPIHQVGTPPERQQKKH